MYTCTCALGIGSILPQSREDRPPSNVFLLLTLLGVHLREGEWKRERKRKRESKKKMWKPINIYFSLRDRKNSQRVRRTILMRETNLCWNSILCRLWTFNNTGSSYRGLKRCEFSPKITPHLVSGVSFSRKKKKKEKKHEKQKNKALKCTSDFTRTCDGDVVGRTDSHYGTCSRARFWTRGGSRFSISRIRHVEKVEKGFSWRWRNGSAQRPQPLVRKAPPSVADIHVCLVFIVRSFYFSIIR